VTPLTVSFSRFKMTPAPMKPMPERMPRNSLKYAAWQRFS
jgi:hypothetical protein